MPLSNQLYQDKTYLVLKEIQINIMKTPLTNLIFNGYKCIELTDKIRRFRLNLSPIRYENYFWRTFYLLEQFHNEPFCTKGLEHDFIACERGKAKQSYTLYSRWSSKALPFDWVDWPTRNLIHSGEIHLVEYFTLWLPNQ